MNFKIFQIIGTLISLFVFRSGYIVAQESRLISKIYVKEGGSICVLLKWYSRELINKEGCNIYRIELPDGIISKRNDRPILPLLNDTEVQNSGDSSYILLASILKNKPEIFKEGLLQLHLFIESFGSLHLSKMLGIFYKDSGLISGKKYVYIVRNIISGKEYYLAKSDTIPTSDFNYKKKIKSFSVRQKKDKLELKWQPQDSAYYAVNIYRTDLNLNAIFKRNAHPIMISSNEDLNGQLKLPEVFYSDSFINTRNSYLYFLKGIDFFGEESYLSDTIKIIVAGNIPPGNVRDLELASNEMTVKLSWKNPEDKDLRGCNIYRSFQTDSLYVRVNHEILQVLQINYFDTVPEAGPWYYKVSSIDSSGNESFSEQLYSEVHDLIPPSVPIGLKLTEDSGKIIICWRRNCENDLAGYLIYRSLLKESNLKPLLLNSNPLKDTFYIDKHAFGKNNIVYQIAAIDYSSNISNYTSPEHIRLKDDHPPIQPRITIVSSERRNVDIKWLANPDADLAYYLLIRSSGNLPSISFKISPDSVLFRDTNLLASNYYDYEIIAVDSAGNYSRPSDKVGIRITSEGKFGNCKSVSLNGRYKKYVHLKWEANQIDGLLGYSIFKLDSTNSYLRISNVIPGNEFMDKNISNGNRYQYQLRTYFSNGLVCVSDSFFVDIPGKKFKIISTEKKQ